MASKRSGSLLRRLSSTSLPRAPAPSFGDPSTAFAGRSTAELFHSYFVFKACGLRPLVHNARKLVGLSQSVLGERLTTRLLKATFARQFVAGEDEADIQPTIQRLSSRGICSILDYAAESDVAPGGGQPEKPGQPATAVPSPAAVEAIPVVGTNPSQRRPFTTRSSVRPALPLEPSLDANLEHSLRGVRAAADTGGFAAVKVTGLAEPELLRTVSAVLVQQQRAFVTALAASGPPSGGEGASSGARPPAAALPEAVLAALRPVLDAAPGSAGWAALHGVAGLPQLAAHLECAGRVPSRAAAERLVSVMDTQGDGGMDALEWGDALAVAALGTPDACEELAAATGGATAGAAPLGLPALSLDDRLRWAAALQRAEALASAAADRGVVCMFDAEQSYIQPAIDFVVAQLQRRYNRPAEQVAAWVAPEIQRARGVAGGSSAPPSPPPAAPPGAASRPRPFVYTTVQAYLRDAPLRLGLSLARGYREGFSGGVKLVRGAYMLQERALAAAAGQPDPIQPNIMATHAAYDACAEALLACAAGGAGEAMIASHNETSIRRVAARMGELGVERATGGIAFAQLLGMCDHISSSLGAQGFRVCKYVPYGPFPLLIAYLMRRLEENGDVVVGGATKEAALLRTEIRRRLLRG